MKIRTFLFTVIFLLSTACQPTNRPAPTPEKMLPPATENPAQTSAPEPPAPKDLVTVRGTSFIVNGEPFRFGGANDHELPWLTPYELDSVLADADALDFRVLRTFASVVIGDVDGENTLWDFKDGSTNGVWFQGWDPMQQKMVINDGPDGLVHLDVLLATAARHNVRLVIALVDNWYYYGGTPQYCAWRQIPSEERWCPNFYTDPATQTDFKTWVSHLLNRTNTMTGIAYRDDPTIFSWQLANEPNIKGQVFVDWVSEISDFIRANDPNHLISIGNASFGLTLEQFSQMLSLPNIDFGTLHMYPAYEQPAFSIIDCDSIMKQYLAVGEQVGKPIVLEEFGLSAEDGDQLQAYKLWTDSMRASPAGGGWMVWRLQGRTAAGIFPPQNPEGFDIHNDNSPITKLLAEAARQMIESAR